jgi:F0F1-type ATP synthase membrane subunit b/b'
MIATIDLELLAQVSQIVGAVVFIIVAVLVWNKYIASGVKAYQASKNAELAEAEARRERMKADRAAAEAEISRADADAQEIRARIVTISGHDHAVALAEAKAEAERIVRNAEGELDRARMAARDRMRIEFIEKALAKARAEAPKRVDAATSERLIQQTVADVVKGRG